MRNVFGLLSVLIFGVSVAFLIFWFVLQPARNGASNTGVVQRQAPQAAPKPVQQPDPDGGGRQTQTQTQGAGGLTGQRGPMVTAPGLTFPPAIVVSGVKFEDHDENGNWNQFVEPPLKGWVIYVYEDWEGDGELSQEEYENGPLARRTTGSMGYYGFYLAPGRNYIIAEGTRNDMRQSAPRPRTTPLPRAGRILENGLVWKRDPATDETLELEPYGYMIREDEALPGTEFLEANFGNYYDDASRKPPPTPRLGEFEVQGVKFFDFDGDGVQNNGERGLKDVYILAYEDGDGNRRLTQDEYNLGPVNTTQTRSNGHYRLVLPAGVDYVILEEPVADMVQSAPNADTFVSPRARAPAIQSPIIPGANARDGKSWKLAPNGYVIPKADARRGNVIPGADFGNAGKTFKISGVKFRDDDGDGTLDNGELLEGGRLIHAYIDDGDGEISQEEYNQGPVASELTAGFPFASLGTYSMTLRAGLSYVVVEERYVGYKQTAPKQGAISRPRGPTGSDSVLAWRLKFGTSRRTPFSAYELEPKGWVINATHAIPDAVHPDLDFGNQPAPPPANPFTVRGEKFEDNNGDGVKNGADAGHQGQTIFAYKDAPPADGVLSQVEYKAGPVAFAPTGAAGAFQLQLNAGSAYILLEEQRTNMAQSAPPRTIGNGPPPHPKTGIATGIVWEPNSADGRLLLLEPDGYLIRRAEARAGQAYQGADFGNYRLVPQPPAGGAESCTPGGPAVPPRNHCVPEFCPSVEIVRGLKKPGVDEALKYWPKHVREAWPDEHKPKQGADEPRFRFGNYWFKNAWMVASRHNAQHFKRARVTLLDADNDPAVDDVEIQCYYATKMKDQNGQVLDIIIEPKLVAHSPYVWPPAGPPANLDPVANRAQIEAYAAESQRIVTYTPWGRFYSRANNNNVDYNCVGRHDECKY